MRVIVFEIVVIYKIEHMLTVLHLRQQANLRPLFPELSGRNREDIQTVARLRAELEEKEQKLHTQEVSFA
jgi:hypothetical protein